MVGTLFTADGIFYNNVLMRVGKDVCVEPFMAETPMTAFVDTAAVIVSEALTLALMEEIERLAGDGFDGEALYALLSNRGVLSLPGSGVLVEIASQSIIIEM